MKEGGNKYIGRILYIQTPSLQLSPTLHTRRRYITAIIMTIQGYSTPQGSFKDSPPSPSMMQVDYPVTPPHLIHPANVPNPEDLVPPPVVQPMEDFGYKTPKSGTSIFAALPHKTPEETSTPIDHSTPEKSRSKDGTFILPLFLLNNPVLVL